MSGNLSWLLIGIVAIFSCSAMDKKSPSSFIEQHDISHICEFKSSQLFNKNCYRYSFAMRLKNGLTVKACHVHFPRYDQYETCFSDKTICATDNTREQYWIAERRYDKQFCIEQAKNALEVTEKAYMQRVYGTTSKQDIWQRWSTAQIIEVIRLEDNQSSHP